MVCFYSHINPMSSMLRNTGGLLTVFFHPEYKPFLQKGLFKKDILCVKVSVK
jgi:hypothetical protein